ncbi:toprim domain-containing protein [Mycolicibacterium houstonense]|uniref:toprim domain-containing protein n=1 Tax=Mycolicibacterium houstonense TaxID=146021 RepID=UPI000833BA13|nr:toprim domain-containing protein [Mycolicibacterium houstonense]
MADPVPGHEQYRGRLAIPYLRWAPDIGWQVVSIRFRRLDDQKPKYMTVAGDRPRLYNTLALLKRSPVIGLAEGEIDAITADIAGIPTVGVPGTQSWQDHFREPFLGYRDVFVFADGDEAGEKFSEFVAGVLPNAKIIPMPPGEDVNSLVTSQGAQALKDRIR